uniref:Dynamin GTPase effector domain-containing protein n=1 Tax=Mola mola TaxID=94237 RepID=A0A3Q3VRA7_MOLML
MSFRSRNQIETIRKERESTAEATLRTQLKMHSIVYTQDSRCSKKLGKRKKEAETNTGFSLLVSNNDSGATLKDMTKHLKSYFQISQQIHSVYFIIQHTYFRYSIRKEMLQVLQDKEKIELLLQKDSGIKTKRAHLQKRIKRLTNACILLTDFSMNIYNFNKAQLQYKEDS